MNPKEKEEQEKLAKRRKRFADPNALEEGETF